MQLVNSLGRIDNNLTEEIWNSCDSISLQYNSFNSTFKVSTQRSLSYILIYIFIMAALCEIIIIYKIFFFFFLQHL